LDEGMQKIDEWMDRWMDGWVIAFFITTGYQYHFYKK
jgi:hypothetical protein